MLPTENTFGVMCTFDSCTSAHTCYRLYFKDWFEAQQADIQQKVREFISTGRFELVGGGWIQNDEACPSTQAIINQMTVGHEYLLSRFNVCIFLFIFLIS
jgi:alpha-mannosidase